MPYTPLQIQTHLDVSEGPLGQVPRGIYFYGVPRNLPKLEGVSVKIVQPIKTLRNEGPGALGTQERVEGI